VIELAAVISRLDVELEAPKEFAGSEPEEACSGICSIHDER
jgi:hypothetical protein